MALLDRLEADYEVSREESGEITVLRLTESRVLYTILDLGTYLRIIPDVDLAVLEERDRALAYGMDSYARR